MLNTIQRNILNMEMSVFLCACVSKTPLDGYIYGDGIFLYSATLAVTPPSFWVLETYQLLAGTLVLAVASPSGNVMTETLGHMNWS